MNARFSLPLTCLGIMSGTSLDGIDMAVLCTDGDAKLQPLASRAYDFPDSLVQALLSVQGSVERNDEIRQIEKTYTDFILQCLQDFSPDSIDYIGWHGQTIGHAPEKRKTLQLGNGNALAKAYGVPVIYDFRQADIKAGGQGAPFVPIYHQAIARYAKLNEPIAFINIGGVANITYCHKDELIAFDIGAGNALMDDVMRQHGKAYDEDGRLASQGKIDEALIKAWLQDSYYTQSYPKSLHREHFHSILSSLPESLSLQDKLANLAELTCLAIVKSFELLPQLPTQIILCGGGRLNKFLCSRLQANSHIKIALIDSYGFDGDMLEAQAFAYLAVRHLRKLPLSFPHTTGVAEALCGGVLAQP